MLLRRSPTFAAHRRCRVMGAAVMLLCLTSGLAQAEALKVNGSTTVNPVVSDAAAVLRREQRLEIQVDVLGGSSGGIAGLGDGRVGVAMSSRPILAEDRRKFPQVDFHSIRIGTDAVALVVSRDLWQGGVRALSRLQVRDIYEGRSTNWAEVGGPDRRIIFFNKEPGRGTWEVFARWLYGDSKRAPLVSHPQVGANEEARNKVASTRGAMSQLSASWADGQRIFALGIRTADGRVVEPTRGHIADGSYPLSRPLLVVTDGEPRGSARLLVDFLRSHRGQELVERHGYLPIAAPSAKESVP